MLGVLTKNIICCRLTSVVLLVLKEEKVLLTTRGGDSGASSSFAFGDENSLREIRLKPPFDAFSTFFLGRGGGDDNSTFMLGVLTENIICCRLLF
jgi:hypothetical protein